MAIYKKQCKPFIRKLQKIWFCSRLCLGSWTFSTIFLLLAFEKLIHAEMRRWYGDERRSSSILNEIDELCKASGES